MLCGGGDVADDGGLGIATKGRLQDSGQFAVTVGDMPACIEARFSVRLLAAPTG